MGYLELGMSDMGAVTDRTIDLIDLAFGVTAVWADADALCTSTG